jgi:flagellar motility protein MotE (MotC chaperone)
MKRCFAVLILVLNLGLLSWSLAQGSRSDLFDQKKVDQELQIMKGILGTTLDFAVRDLQPSSAHKTSDRRHFVHTLGWNNISGFYLYGQGATFIIPTSELALPWQRHGRITLNASALESGEVAYAEAIEASQEAMQEAQEELVEVQEEFRDQMEEADEASREAPEAGTLVTVPSPPVPPSAPAVAPAPPARPARPAVGAQATPRPKPDQETIRKRLAAAQEKVKKRQEVLEQRRQKFQEALAQLKVHLVEALANHGDSLTTVKPNEYINLVLSTDMGGVFVPGGRDESQRDIISVQKSVVSDYRAGKLTLETLKQKVLQYAN